MAGWLLPEWFIFSIMFYSPSLQGSLLPSNSSTKDEIHFFIFTYLKTCILVGLPSGKWKIALVGIWRRQGSVWKLGFVYCRAGFCFIWMGFRSFFNVLLTPHCYWLTVQMTERLSKGSWFRCVELYCSFSFHLATETLCKQELLQVNIKLEKVLKAFRWLWKWKDEFSM